MMLAFAEGGGLDKKYRSIRGHIPIYEMSGALLCQWCVTYTAALNRQC